MSISINNDINTNANSVHSFMMIKNNKHVALTLLQSHHIDYETEVLNANDLILAKKYFDFVKKITVDEQYFKWVVDDIKNNKTGYQKMLKYNLIKIMPDETGLFKDDDYVPILKLILDYRSRDTETLKYVLKRIFVNDYERDLSEREKIDLFVHIYNSGINSNSLDVMISTINVYKENLEYWKKILLENGYRDIVFYKFKKIISKIFLEATKEKTEQELQANRNDIMNSDLSNGKKQELLEFFNEMHSKNALIFSKNRFLRFCDIMFN